MGLFVALVISCGFLLVRAALRWTANREADELRRRYGVSEQLVQDMIDLSCPRAIPRFGPRPETDPSDRVEIDDLIDLGYPRPPRGTPPPAPREPAVPLELRLDRAQLIQILEVNLVVINAEQHMAGRGGEQGHYLKEMLSWVRGQTAEVVSVRILPPP